MRILKEFGPIVTTPLLFPRGNKAFTEQFIQVKANQNMHIFHSKIRIVKNSNAQMVLWAFRKSF